MKEKKFEKGDRVKVMQVPMDGVMVLEKGMVGTIVGLYENLWLVKFDTVKLGHTGCLYYLSNNLDFEPHNQSHWYMLPSHLEKVEEKEKENEKK